MKLLKLRARAKINLTLDVLRRREDGYHDLQMALATVPLCDDITIMPLNKPELSVETNLAYLPSDARNLALTAAKRFFSRAGLEGLGAHISIIKRIPVSAGLGGGSSDAAAVLRGLNRHFGEPLSQDALSELALELGSDVPYCLYGGTALAEGRGERLTALPSLPDCFFVLSRPYAAVSTKEAFHSLQSSKIKCRPDLAGMLEALESGDLVNIARRMYNVFEPLLEGRIKELGHIRGRLIHAGALGACMSGTGATMLGLFGDAADARRAYDDLKAEFDDTFLVAYSANAGY